jgi:hypothetical protein
MFVSSETIKVIPLEGSAGSAKDKDKSFELLISMINDKEFMKFPS